MGQHLAVWPIGILVWLRIVLLDFVDDAVVVHFFESIGTLLACVFDFVRQRFAAIFHRVTAFFDVVCQSVRAVADLVGSLVIDTVIAADKCQAQSQRQSEGLVSWESSSWHFSFGEVGEGD